MITKEFVLGGRAVFTIQEPDGKHHTFRITRKDPENGYPEAWFVGFLSGPDNTRNYTYLGKLDRFTFQVSTTAKSEQYRDSFKLKLLNRVLTRIYAGDAESIEQHGYKVHHEGKCCRCGRALTVPESIESGIGPECAQRSGFHVAKELDRLTKAEREQLLEALKL